VIFDLWSGRTQLVGMAQLSLQTPDQGLQDNSSSTFKGGSAVEGMALQAVAFGFEPLHNPLMNKLEREELESCGKLTVRAGIFAPSEVGATVQGPNTGLAPAKEGVEPFLQGGIMVSHTFRVTVCGGLDLPDPKTLLQLELPVPRSRFLQYIYPGGRTFREHSEAGALASLSHDSQREPMHIPHGNASQSASQVLCTHIKSEVLEALFMSELL
jgi:hypothetical protein